jgi:hypothetical protein
MKNIKIGGTLCFIGAIIFVIENFYFGWNMKPLSDAERYADIIVKIFIYLGIYIYMAPVFKLYEEAVEKYDKLKKSKEV